MASLTTAIEYPSVVASTSTTVHAVATITGSSRPSDTARTPVHASVVLDKSGSMRGDKLDRAKETLQFLVRELQAGDHLSLVLYDTDVATTLRHLPMTSEGKAEAKRAIEKIQPGSTTNLSGGVLAGIDAVRRAAVPTAGNAVQSVLLLTDGHANVGLRTAEQLLPVVRGALDQTPGATSLFTFGFGKSHDSGLLRDVADAGGGVYYFIEEVDNIPLAYSDCLGGLTSVVAQNLELEVSVVAPDGVRIAEVLTKFKTETLEAGRRVLVRIGDIYAEEDRAVPVRLAVDPSAAPHDDAKPLLRFELRFADAINARLESAAADVALARPAVEAEPRAAADAGVAAQVNRVLAAAAMDAAKGKAEAGDFAGAKAAVEAAVADVGARAAAAAGGDDDDEVLTAQLLDDLRDVGAGLTSRQAYLSSGMQHELASKSQQHYMQRSNCLQMSMSASGAISMKKNAYRKASKMRMMSKGLSLRSAKKAPASAPPEPPPPQRKSSFSNLLDGARAKLGL